MASDTQRKNDMTRGAKASKSPGRQLMEGYVNHHRKVARNSAERMWRSPIASLMTWAVIGVALALPMTLLLLLSSLEGVSAGWDSSARLTAYVELSVPLEDAEAIVERVASDGRIDEVELVNRDQAFTEFRASSGLEDALDFLDENPLPHAVLITPEVTARSEAGMQGLIRFIEAIEGIERVQVDLGWLQRLNAVTDLMVRAVWVLSLLLATVVVLVIGNTVRLAIENRRDEILVAKLVGGTDAFVRRPFLYTGAWFGLGGGILAWIVLEVSLWWLSGPIERLAELYRTDFSLSGLGLGGGLSLIIAAMVLGWLGAWLAVKRHMDDIEPGEIAGG